ncbi:MAG: hypothetical protein KBD06_00040 [Candidatus Pacebacteria bacterium]|nr:hypothetical protein [Candidatus Paceibacterota bacterium]
MADQNGKEIWFKRRRFGWGWEPATWQGWLVLAAYIVAVIAFALTIDENSPPREIAFTFVLPITFLTMGFIRFCYAYGEEPRWSWGNEK